MMPNKDGISLCNDIKRRYEYFTHTRYIVDSENKSGK